MRPILVFLCLFGFPALAESLLGRSGRFNDAITLDGRIGISMALFDADGQPLSGDAVPVRGHIELRPIPIAKLKTDQEGLVFFDYSGTPVYRLLDKDGRPLVLRENLLDNGLNIQMGYSGNPSSNQKVGIPNPCRLRDELDPNPGNLFNGECYRGILFAPLSPPRTDPRQSKWWVHSAPIEIDVIAFGADGKRLPQPRVVRAQLTRDFASLTTKQGNRVEGAELSVTADGRLLFATGTYFNDTPGYGNNGWSESIDVFRLHDVTRNLSILGIPFHRRYPLAAAPITDLLGRECDEKICGFDYPWVSQDGADLFFNQTLDALGAERSSFTMVGARTRHKLVVIDGPFNLERLTGPGRLQSLGLLPSMWAQFPEWDAPGSLLPFHKGEPGYFLFGRSLGRFTEVPLRELVDENYLVYLRMNEYVRPRTAAGEDEVVKDSLGNPIDNRRFSREVTPDTSGKGNHGRLVGGVLFPHEARRRNPALVSQGYGFTGKGLFFTESGLVRVDTGGTDALVRGLRVATWQLAVKPLRRASRRLVLAHQGPVWRISLTPEGALFVEGQLTEPDGSLRSFSFPTGLVLPVGRWSHVALTLRRPGNQVRFTAYVHEAQREESAVLDIPSSGYLATNGLPIRIGPGATGGTASSGFFAVLDEFGLSDIPRSLADIRRAARYQGGEAVVWLEESYPNPTNPGQRLTLTRDKLPQAIRRWLDDVNPDSAYSARKVQVPVAVAYHVYEKGRYDAARALGDALFHDEQLTGKSISCASCHLAGRAFADGRIKSVGAPGRPLRRHTPTLANRIFSTAQFWDGRRATLLAQAWDPILNPEEMAGNEAAVIRRLRNAPLYGPLFAALGVQDRSQPPDTYYKNWVALALTTFELDRILPTGLVDQIERRHNVRGGDALVAAVQRGRALFYGKARCTNCHSGGNFTDERFHNTGTFDSGGRPVKDCGSAIDCGRFEATQALADLGAFKTPTLRGIGRTAPYFHDGSRRTLREVVEHYNAAVPRSGGMSVDLVPLDLTDGEMDDLIAFLEAM